MTIGSFLAEYWWLIFPVFGMALALQGAGGSDKRAQAAMETVRAYVEKGKDPPPELLRMATQAESQKPGGAVVSRAWTFTIFLALAVGFSTAWYMLRGDDPEFVFALVAIAMSVMALGSLLILIFAKRD